MSPFVLDLVASFAIGGLWVTLSSLTAQSLGGRVGGFLAGLPATAALALFFITYSEGARHGYEAAGFFVPAISINALFLAAFAAGSRRSFASGLSVGLGIWTSLQAMLLFAHPTDIKLMLGLGVVSFLLSAATVGRLDLRDPGRGRGHHGIPEIVLSALSGGSIIVLAMIGSRLGGPVLGGILSAFPASTVGTLVITNAYGGKELARFMAWPMMVSGVVNCLVFALAFRHVVLHMDILGALASAYGVTLLASAFTFWLAGHPLRPHTTPRAGGTAEEGPG